MTVPPVDGPPGLAEAFWCYERALMANDVPELDRSFAPGPTTLRGDAQGLLVGHAAISAFRGARRVPQDGRPWRTVVEVHVQTVDPDHALVVAVTELAPGGRGQQTQLWARLADGWRVTAAHVSVPAPALDRRIWRVVGAPLLAGAPGGVLAGESVAVKDVFAVAGHPTGVGNPAWLAHAAPAPAHAWAVRRLLEAGADVRGIASTDEFAYSLAGQNAHHGTPPNPRAPYRLSGGSSSGSATAVALGHATVGLGTDTGGSVRVPAAYQGLFGIRTTHGAVPTDGLVPLAPAFDTVGWMTRDAGTLGRVGEVLLSGQELTGVRAEMTVVTELLELASPEVVDAVLGWLDRLPPDLSATRVSWREDFESWRRHFTVVQARQAWEVHGEWLASRLATLGPDVRARFSAARDLDAAGAESATAAVAAIRTRIGELVGERVLVLPSTSSVAPLPAGADAVREPTMRLTCVASLGGLPAVTVPLETAGGLPCGVCLVAAPGRDRDLLALVGELPANGGPGAPVLARG